MVILVIWLEIGFYSYNYAIAEMTYIFRTRVEILTQVFKSQI